MDVPYLACLLRHWENFSKLILNLLSLRRSCLLINLLSSISILHWTHCRPSLLLKLLHPSKFHEKCHLLEFSNCLFIPVSNTNCNFTHKIRTESNHRELSKSRQKFEQFFLLIRLFCL